MAVAVGSTCQLLAQIHPTEDMTEVFNQVFETALTPLLKMNVLEALELLN
jgi:hypothetical protein